MTEETLFEQALGRSPGERAPFLDEVCAGRPERHGFQVASDHYLSRLEIRPRAKT